MNKKETVNEEEGLEMMEQICRRGVELCYTPVPSSVGDTQWHVTSLRLPTDR